MKYDRYNLARTKRELDSRGWKRAEKAGVAFRGLLLTALVGVAVLGICMAVGLFRGILDTAPDISKIDVTPTGFSTFVYDSEGNQTAKLVSTDANRIPVTLSQVPLDLQHAFVAIEDERFYEHSGIDIQGIVRAAIRGLTTGNFDQGASTITQQLLKNSVFTGWTNETFSEAIRRKIQEQYLAVELEKTMSKDDILINYLNTINLGHNTLGVQAASQRYFDKDVSRLTLSECAVIAGITQNPTKYDPITYPANNDERRRMVLEKMLEQGYIDETQYRDAIEDPVYSRIHIVDEETDDNKIQSYFVDALTNQVLDDLQKEGYTEQQAYTLLYSGGLKIYSTQDPSIQAICDEVVADDSLYPNGTRWYLTYSLSIRHADDSVDNYSSGMLRQWLRDNNIARSLLFSSKDDAVNAYTSYREAMTGEGDTVAGEHINLQPQPQISLTIEDQHTGNVVAMVGGRGDKTANRTLNRAYDTYRQPGSTFKVVSTYAPALDAGGFTLASTQNDAPFTYKDGVTPVRNWYGESYRGLCSVRDGIRDSLNIVAVKTLTDITPELGYSYLQDFGITSLVSNEEINGQIYSDVQQTLALGGITKGVTNFELNAAYATIANGGMYLAPKMYTKITDHDGNIVLDADNRETRRVIKETTAWLLTSAMQDVVTKGTGTSVNFGTTPIAGKTGTTSDENDVWFAGYTNYYCATAWAGYDENTDLVGSESRLARTIWRAVMEKVHEGLPSSSFEMPDGIIQMSVCRASGKLPVNGSCRSNLVTEYFDKDMVPTETCDVHGTTEYCEVTGLPAVEDCPFKTTGRIHNAMNGVTCPHTEEFMAQDNIDAVIEEERAWMESRQLGGTVILQGENPDADRVKLENELSDKESALGTATQQAQIGQDHLNEVNSNYANAERGLQQAQAALQQAQASGNAEEAARLEQEVAQAQAAYAEVAAAKQEAEQYAAATQQQAETARQEAESARNAVNQYNAGTSTANGTSTASGTTTADETAEQADGTAGQTDGTAADGTVSAGNAADAAGAQAAGADAAVNQTPDVIAAQ